MTAVSEQFAKALNDTFRRLAVLGEALIADIAASGNPAPGPHWYGEHWHRATSSLSLTADLHRVEPEEDLP